MAKIFYDHLVAIEDIVVELDKHELHLEEREELISLADQTLHHHVLDVILTHLPKDKHPEFLEKFHATPHDEKLLEYLKKEIEEDIEMKIKEEAKKVKKEILAEIRRSKK